jgi:hypothetical protein
MDIALLFICIAVILWMEIKATLIVLRDSLSEPRQRVMQLALIWLLPLLGAIVVLAVHRPVEKHSGKYREKSDPGDDFGFPWKNARGHSDGMDGD